MLNSTVAVLALIAVSWSLCSADMVNCDYSDEGWTTEDCCVGNSTECCDSPQVSSRVICWLNFV